MSKNHEGDMRDFSETASKIAALYSGVLASETRDLTARIEAALKAEYLRGYEDACKWADTEVEKMRTTFSG